MRLQQPQCIIHCHHNEYTGYGEDKNPMDSIATDFVLLFKGLYVIILEQCIVRRSMTMTFKKQNTH